MHVDKNQSFYKSTLSFSVEVARHIQSIQNRNLVMFLQYLKKKLTTAFVFYCDAKYSDFLRGVSHVLCYLLSYNFSRYNFEKLIRTLSPIYSRDPFIDFLLRFP